METVGITGGNGSIGQALVVEFNRRSLVGQAPWTVVPWNLRLVPNYSSANPEDRWDALVLAHGGYGKDSQAFYENNTLTVERILRRIDELVKPTGCVILVASRRAIRPTIDEWDYSAAKAAARAYALALYRDRPQRRITVVSPGWVESKQATRDYSGPVIPVLELCRLIRLVVESPGLRIPEIALEPLGSNQLA